MSGKGLEPNSCKFFTDKRSSFPLGDLKQPTDVEKHALPMHFVSKHALMHSLILPVPSAFSTQGLEASYFPQLKKHQPLAGEKGGIVSTMAFTPRPTTQ